MDAALRRGGISLADVADFNFGALAISPSTRQVTHRGTSITLEPRVMQVLIALAEAEGRVVSRDALLQRCWTGTIVGDNAINRVIARLRRLAEETGAFTIETVVRVGYRVSAAEAEDEATAEVLPADAVSLIAKADAPAATGPGGAKRPVDRRRLLIGGVGLMGVAGAVLFLRSSGAAGADDGAAALVTKARYFSEIGLRNGARQAIRILEEAVALYPGSAQAWGALALALANHIWWAWDAEAEDFYARAGNAAARARAIDPDNADAALALVVRQNWLGRWTAHENALRAVVARHPGHSAARGELAFLLCQAGRWADALTLIERLAGEARLSPRLYELHGHALAARGRRLEADWVLADGLAKWPSVPAMWSTRFEYLLATGRLSDARAMVTDRVRLEFHSPTIPMDLGLEVTGALDARPDERARAKAAAKLLAAREQGAIWSPAATRLLVLLAEPVAALQVARAYLVGGESPGGRAIPPPSRYVLRRTDFLFLPFVAPLHALGGFSDLMETIGLAPHWRGSGTAPQTGA